MAEKEPEGPKAEKEPEGPKAESGMPVSFFCSLQTTKEKDTKKGVDKSSQLQYVPEKWEPPLMEDECARLQELGLGVAVDITKKQTWGKKSAFQAKEVKEKAELIVINESNQFKKYHEVVESYSEVQTALESSFRPTPNQPIDVSIAADYHRSVTNKKSMRGETVLTRTVAFKMRDPAKRVDNKEEFEVQLHEWLKQSNCIKKGNKKSDGSDIPEESKIPARHSDECEEDSFMYYTPATNHACIDFLKALGGVTHYVSSITLGANQYQVETEKLTNTTQSYSAGGKVNKKVKTFVASSKTEAIGRVPPRAKDGTARFLMKFRTKDEAVVRCSFTSLSHLVSHPGLQRELEAAIQEYIDCQLHGTRGPYYITTAVEQSLGGGTRAQLYWRVEVSKLKDDESTLQYQITCTDDFEKACNFYLKPFEDKYFLIATDPEDERIIKQLHEIEEQSKRVASQLVDCPEESHKQPDPTSCKRSTAGYKRVPQRFVQMCDIPAGQLSALSAEIGIDKRRAAFKLKNPHRHSKHSLIMSKSQWLPEAAHGSEPYFIYLRGSSFQHKSASILSVGEENGKYVITCDNGDNTDNKLFVLKRGHKS